MKKLLLCVSVLLAFLTVSAFAAETVIYENDFSDPSTLSDFEQYVQEWEIKNGGLYFCFFTFFQYDHNHHLQKDLPKSNLPPRSLFHRVTAMKL